jgi:two-component system response regulator PilR (NtrC family)
VSCIDPRLEEELFGYARGAFAGATRDCPGQLVSCHGGSLFLDEIEACDRVVQAKLANALEKGVSRRRGDVMDVPFDVRLIAASESDLKTEVFRADLYYRLGVIQISIPPLRERKEDIPLLALHFAKQFAARLGKPADHIDEHAMRRLQSYSWPGNVRELENVIERAVALSKHGEITEETLADRLPAIRPVHERPAGAQAQLSIWTGSVLPDEGVDLEALTTEMEGAYLRAALEKAHGVRTVAAHLLKMSYRSFRHYAKKHRL